MHPRDSFHDIGHGGDKGSIGRARTPKQMLASILGILGQGPTQIDELFLLPMSRQKRRRHVGNRDPSFDGSPV